MFVSLRSYEQEVSLPRCFLAVASLSVSSVRSREDRRGVSERREEWHLKPIVTDCYRLRERTENEQDSPNEQNIEAHVSSQIMWRTILEPIAPSGDLLKAIVDDEFNCNIKSNHIGKTPSSTLRVDCRGQPTTLSLN